MQFIIGTTMLWISTAAIERMKSVRVIYFKSHKLLRVSFVVFSLMAMKSN